MRWFLCSVVFLASIGTLTIPSAIGQEIRPTESETSVNPLPEDAIPGKSEKNVRLSFRISDKLAFSIVSTELRDFESVGKVKNKSADHKYDVRGDFKFTESGNVALIIEGDIVVRDISEEKFVEEVFTFRTSTILKTGMEIDLITRDEMKLVVRADILK